MLLIKIALFASLSQLVSGDACSNPKYWTGVRNVSIEVGSVTRTFQLSTPWEGKTCGDNNQSWCTTPPTSRKPLVFNWHGCSGHVPVLDYAEEVSRMVNAAKDHGWYAITPVGTQSGTEALPGSSVGFNADGIECGTVGMDDFAFFEAMMNFTEAELCVDMSAIHSAGFSTGAFMTYGIACRYPDLIVAAGTDAGGLSHTEYSKCLAGTGAVPMQSFHSLTDTTVPYNGTDLWAGQEAMNELWLARNGCDGSETPTMTFNTSTSVCYRWDCPDAPVEACALDNIEHCWYGGRSGGFTDCEARSTDVDATATMFSLWGELADAKAEKQ